MRKILSANSAGHSPLQALCVLPFGLAAGYPDQTLCQPASGLLLQWSFHLMNLTHLLCTCQNPSYNRGLPQSNIFFITTFLISLSLLITPFFHIPLKFCGHCTCQHESRTHSACCLLALALEWLLWNQTFFVALFLYYNSWNFPAIIMSQFNSHYYCTSFRKVIN